MNVIFSREKMKALLVIVYITCSTNVGATFWNSKIKILCYGEKNIDLILTYELKDNEIYEEIIVPKKDTKSGKDELIRLAKLDECVIKNSKNWVCGGKSTQSVYGAYRSELHTVF